ncbi:hypothetical protein LEL_05922 [Akanthomyces lecanii RCEF 1005]|uniref:Uncharacterized protein n=1 Tax=Akanthomyces lecanii RCEF 1005 TaxID=1081108 RepID=A0A162KKB1_CORDF|nr:hypothetical protein LEL_05922 [Akanthomyces lecanii RCEF 1005]
MFAIPTTEPSKPAPPAATPSSGRVSRFVAAACLILYSVSNGLLARMAINAVSEPAEDLQFVGSIAGAFVKPHECQMAIVMFHVNLIMGTLFAGIASALAPWMGCKTIAVV